MNTLVYILIFISLTSISNGQSLDFEDFLLQENFPIWAKKEPIKLEKDVIVVRSLNPFYLEADFNGGGMSDLALHVVEKESGKHGILILHAETGISFLIGCGNEFANAGDSFDWLEVWRVYKENTAQVTTFKENGYGGLDIDGNETVDLQNIAIQVASSEGSSNLIMWEGEKYIWIHTGD